MSASRFLGRQAEALEKTCSYFEFIIYYNEINHMKAGEARPWPGSAGQAVAISIKSSCASRRGRLLGCVDAVLNK